jgi:hypothetical protein
VRRPPTLRQRRAALDAAQPAEFTPAADTAPVTLPGLMDRGTFTQKGWIAPAHVSREGLQQVGLAILAIQHATPWMWADWYISGGDPAMLPAGRDAPDKHTLENYAAVAKRFPHSRRREHVSFKHHAELAALTTKDQDALLDWCDRPQPPSVTALRAEKARRITPPAKPPRPPALPPARPAPPPAPLIIPPVAPPVVEPEPAPDLPAAIRALDAALDTAARVLGRKAVIAHLKQWIAR